MTARVVDLVRGGGSGPRPCRACRWRVGWWPELVRTAYPRPRRAGGLVLWGCRAMSVKAMTWVWGLEELPQKETLVLLALADQANDEGLCWPRLDTLAPKSRMSVRSVKRAVAFLRRAGLVETTIRSSQEGRRGNVYRLMVGAEYCASDLQRANLAPCGEPVDNSPVENPDMPRQDCKGPIWPLADESSQGARGGPLLGARGGPLLPYRRAADGYCGGVLGGDDSLGGPRSSCGGTASRTADHAPRASELQGDPAHQFLGDAARCARGDQPARGSGNPQHGNARRGAE